MSRPLNDPAATRPTLPFAWALRAGLLLSMALTACSAGGAAGIAGRLGGGGSATVGTGSGNATLAAEDTTSTASAISLANAGHIALKANANKCLGIGPDGASVGLYECAGLTEQSWTADGNALKSGDGRCLTVDGAAQAGATLKLASCGGQAAAQIWTLNSHGIVQGSSNLCLDVKDFNQAEGTPVQLWTCAQTVNQLWQVSATTAKMPGTGAWVTSPDLRLAMSEVAVLQGSSADAAAGATLTLDAQTTFQTITGFGASLTDSSSYLLKHGLTEASTQAAMARLFDPNSGIGLSLLRQPMGSSDFSSVGNFSYDDTPNDTSLSNFSIAQDMNATVPLLKTAVKLNPDLFIMGTPWSPPAWMKNNNSMYGSPAAGGDSTLNKSDQAVYAQYFVKFLEAYAAQGITVSAVTPQNEPLNDGSLPSMYFPAHDQATFVGQYLGPALKKAQLGTKVWAYDHNWDHPEYPQTVIDDGQARPFVNAAAFHCYGGDVSAMGTFHDKNPDVLVQMTECSDGAWHGNSFADMSNLIIDSTNNWSSSVVLWALALDPSGGPMNNGCNNCTAFVTVDKDAKTIRYDIDFYIMGQAAKFVRPGAKRIATQLSGNNLNTVAFVNPDQSLVALLYNTSGDAQTVKVQGPKTVAVTVPAGALATVRIATAADDAAPTASETGSSAAASATSTANGVASAVSTAAKSN